MAVWRDESGAVDGVSNRAARDTRHIARTAYRKHRHVARVRYFERAAFASALAAAVGSCSSRACIRDRKLIHIIHCCPLACLTFLCAALARWVVAVADVAVQLIGCGIYLHETDLLIRIDLVPYNLIVLHDIHSIVRNVPRCATT